jgi:predicted TIM-barrel fold metal-dependent hydrolase
VSELGLRGVAWHHRFEGAYIDNPIMPALVRKCDSLGVPAVIHTIAGSSLEGSWRLERLLEQCPEATVVALDPFSGVDRAEEVIAIAERHENLSCDLGAMLSVAGWLIRKFLALIGPGRLMLGTDLYLSPRTWYAPAPLNEIIHMDIPTDAKRAILSQNALRMFGPQSSELPTQSSTD